MYLVMMTNLLIAADGSQFFYTLRSLIDALVPIGICVILPIIVITLAMKTRRHELDKKTEVLLKAVENGTTLDPAFFQGNGRKKTVKEMLMGWLKAGCITTALGIMTGGVLGYALSLGNHLEKNPEDALLLIFPAALIAIGISFFIVYFIGKNKTWKKELAELDAKKPEE